MRIVQEITGLAGVVAETYKQRDCGPTGSCYFVPTAKVPEQSREVTAKDGSRGKLWESVSGNNKEEPVICSLQVKSYQMQRMLLN